MSVLNTIVPVFAVVLLGSLLAGRRGLHVGTLGDLALLVTSPCLMFSVLSGSAVEPGRWAVLCGGVVWIMLGTGLAAALYVRTAGGGRRGLVLPAVFWNSGNMGLACARLAFGEPGLEAAAIVFVTVAVFSSSAGIWIAKGENGLGEVLRIPLVYASLGGLGLALAGIELPRLVMEPIEMLGDMAIPLMLLNLGFQLRTLRGGDVGHALAAVAIRVGGGFALALGFVALFEVGGVERQVLMLQAVMPAAVINAVLAQRYETDPALVASAIVIGTLLSLLTIPAVLLWVS